MTTTEQAAHAMHRALDLAARGPATGENPQVGCVLLDSAGRIVAEGWHRGAGTPHAEVDAMNHLATVDGRPDASGLTAVVTLEPCNHTGHTGPCAEALIAAGIAEVFYAVADPSPPAGGGALRLAAAGIPTTGGILGVEAEEFQHKWLTAASLRRPYVTVKWASTLDGRAAAEDGTSQWITGTAARQRVHEQREASDAILVGTGTALADDPSLTARGDAGELMEHQPIAVVIGERPIAENAKLRKHPGGLIEARTRDLEAALADLFDRGIRRVYVEGGPTLASALVAAGLVDEYAIYLAPALLGGDRVALGDIGVHTIPDIKRLEITRLERLGNDVLITARPVRE
ncbi:MAG: diaminohydroxyphosphoribosylaminopyrimidine deaminase [Actinomycetota bacterium]|jgi:diaminohydroxyphosphoribosylaminopyrimidine deaminase/5-amino-6-(5-phosphoribosylamino)uracil reductase|nr:diaminohydroxyphosphoribosylaminopyrimidine deaminase [Actinomycetota bacterium]MDQ1561747.1 diaminohydroxyphosphoribosylaminopyrimidine deaminase [Actinomycetota bacterium]MDQ1564474.1 diaminohydroxyphosphoribosylaminopyrimidine deaminase [Actinomycetota bacterium]